MTISYTEIKGTFFGAVFALWQGADKFLLDASHAMLMGAFGALGGYLITKILKKIWK